MVQAEAWLGLFRWSDIQSIDPPVGFTSASPGTLPIPTICLVASRLLATSAVAHMNGSGSDLLPITPFTGMSIDVV